MTWTHSARRMAVAATVAAALALVAACAPTFRGGPILEGVAQVDPQVALGERVFAHACHACHPNALAGLGPGIVDKPIPSWLVRLQVRIGLGVMPAFSAEEIDDEELDALVAYLDALRER